MEKLENCKTCRKDVAAGAKSSPHYEQEKPAFTIRRGDLFFIALVATALLIEIISAFDFESIKTIEQWLIYNAKALLKTVNDQILYKISKC